MLIGQPLSSYLMPLGDSSAKGRAVRKISTKGIAWPTVSALACGDSKLIPKLGEKGRWGYFPNAEYNCKIKSLCDCFKSILAILAAISASCMPFSILLSSSRLLSSRARFLCCDLSSGIKSASVISALAANVKWFPAKSKLILLPSIYSKSPFSLVFCFLSSSV